MKTILIAGGTGLIGRQLTVTLLSKGYHMNVLSRKTQESHKENLQFFIWDVKNDFIDLQAFEGVDTIINLSGVNIGSKRWSNARKKKIIQSRTQSTELLYNSIKQNNITIDTYISASAVGYYGSITSNKVFTENDPPGNDFLAKVTQAWENSALMFNNLDVRTVLMRTGVVFDNQGGAMTKILQPIKSGFGSVLGTGRQIIPWIHIDDIVNAYIFMIENTLEGAYNITAPKPVNNRELTKLIAKIINKAIWLPALPKFLLKMILGEMAVLVLEGSAVTPQKLMDSGFEFKFSQPEEALTDLLL